MLRKITHIVYHCSASRPKAAAKETAADIDAMHKARGWRKIGYHYFIRRDGTVEKGRREDEIGSGVFGFNAHSIHICYAGGVDENGKAKDTRTLEQLTAMEKLSHDLFSRYPAAKGCGHRDFSPDRDGDGEVEPHEWMKECPCFDASDWLRSVDLGARALS